MKKIHEHLTSRYPWYANWHNHPHHTHIHTVALILFVGLFTLQFFNALAVNQNATKPLSQTSVENKSLLDLNNKLLSLSYRYQHAPTAEMKAALLAQLTETASQRKSELLTVMKKSPKDFNQYSFPETIRKNLPSEISSYIESKSTIEGKYSVYHKDDFVNPSNTTWDYIIKTKEGKTYHLNSAVDISIQPNSVVKVTGTVLDQQIMLAADGTTLIGVQTISSAPLPKSSIGEQKTAVVLFTGSTSLYTSSQMNDLFFAEPSVNPKSVNSYFKETSFGQTWFTGDVFGPYNIPATADCNTVVTSLKQQVLTATGIDIVAQYPRIVYVSSGDGMCGNMASFDGAAYIASNNTTSLLPLAYHELGHVFSINHANALRCGTKQIDVFSNCTNVGYGDPYSSMGSPASGGGQAPFQYNAMHKTQISWLPMSKIQYITTDGTYTVYASEKNQPGPQILSIYKPDFNQYANDGTIKAKGYLSINFRQAYGFDSSIPSNVTSGANIHLNRVQNSIYGYDQFTYLLDATPGDDSSLHNKAVLDGMTFTDSINGVSIKQLSHTTDSATVQVNFFTPTCTTGKTVVTVPSQGTYSNVIAGETRAVSVNVYNADAGSCNSTNFTISANIPTGWTVVPATISVPPSSVGIGTIYITSPSTTIPGQYQVVYKASDTSVAEHNTLATSTNYFVVKSSTDPNPPTVNLTSPTNGSTVSGAVTLEASASDDVGVTKVDFYRGTTLIGSDTSAPYSLSWDTTSVSDGAYSLSAKAYDAVGNSASSPSVSVTVSNVVTPPADTTAPSVSMTSPTTGATISGVATISASATDNVGVDHVDFYRGTSLIGADATAPYSIPWDTTIVANGTYSLSAKAYDAAGNSNTSASVSVTISNTVTPPADTTAPTVSMTTPTNGSTVSGSVTLGASASDTNGVTKVSFYRGSTLIDTDTTGPSSFAVLWDTTTVANGTYSISAKASDAAGNVGTSSTISVTVNNTTSDTTPPIATITSPVSGTVITARTSGVVVKGNGTDNSGVIARNEILINGAVVSSNTNSTTINYKWSTRKLTTGTHNITLRTYDPSGNMGQTSVTITKQ